MSANSEVSALVALIANATKTIEAIFSASSQPRVPSLDDTAPHPFDTGISSMEMRQAVQTLEGACAQLTATVARPSHTMVNKLMQIYEPACLQVAVMFQIPDVLQKKPAGMHVSEIAQETNIEVGKLGRVLRLLAAKHCFREVSKDVFANNRLSMELLASNHLSDLALHFTDENNKSTAMLAETLADPIMGPSYAPEHTAFNKWSGSAQPLFTYYDGDAPGAGKRGTRFGLAMVGWGCATEGSAITKYFPWDELPDGAAVCDVGGGVGHITMQLVRAFPRLRFTLQDRPDRMHEAQTLIWPRECPEALEQARIRFKAIDFLAESPVRGCDVYYMKNIIHDWPDKECIQILNRVRESMAPHSRLLIQEYILQHVNREPDETEFTPAPAPLLPNYGVGRIRQYSLDIDMLVMVNSKERRLAEFVTLGEEAGLRFVRPWDLGEMSVLEFRLA